MEAVFEERGLKAEITKKRRGISWREIAVFGSNTSTLADHRSRPSASVRPDKFIGIHFFSPVDRMGLVEIIMGATDQPGNAGQAAVDYVLRIKQDAHRRQ